MSKKIVTRFAPSPTGRLHLGHAYSALKAWSFARKSGGRFLLRIEDIDQGRCRREFEKAIFEDLAWLGITWEMPVRRQSEHMGDYRTALDRLGGMGLSYPCFCTRREIAAEVEASNFAPQGPAGPIYPGTCRGLSAAQRQHKIDLGEAYSIRLDIAATQDQLAGRNQWPLFWQEENTGQVEASPQNHGDVILARKDTPTSYHLAVTLDDAVQGVSHVIRGQDLAHSTHIHRLLQALLDLETPDYCHHRLLTNDDGQRLAKRDRAQTLSSLRELGQTPEHVLKRLAVK